MSGGSMDYLYLRVENASFDAHTPERKAFRILLDKVAKALRAIEWNDSGDGAGDEDELIRACFSENADHAVLKAAIEDAIQVQNTLSRVITNAIAEQEKYND